MPARANQGGTAKRQLSPLQGWGLFFIYRKVQADAVAEKEGKGGGRVESDLGELGLLEEKRSDRDYFQINRITAAPLHSRRGSGLTRRNP